MREVISLLLRDIEQTQDFDYKLKLFELLIRAKAIEILRVEAESGMGFAIEAIGKISVFNTSSTSMIVDVLDNLSKVLYQSLNKEPFSR